MQAMNSLLMAWGITDFLTGAQTNISASVKVIVMILGFVLIGVGIYKGAKGFISKKGDTNWVMVVLMIVVGVILSTTSGWSTITSLGNKGFDAVNTLGNTTVLFPFIP